jgi:hypothetical protein
MATLLSKANKSHLNLSNLNILVNHVNASIGTNTIFVMRHLLFVNYLKLNHSKSMFAYFYDDNQILNNKNILKVLILKVICKNEIAIFVFFTKVEDLFMLKFMHEIDVYFNHIELIFHKNEPNKYNNKFLIVLNTVQMYLNHQ